MEQSLYAVCFSRIGVFKEFPPLPKEDKIRKRAGGVFKRFAQQDELLLPDRFIHGKESDISFRDLFCNAVHVANDTVYLVVLTLKEIKAVLNPSATQCLKLFAKKSLVLGFRDIIGKHHEHAGRKA